MLWARVALFVLVYPAYMLLIDHTSVATLALATALLALLTGIGGAPTLVAIRSCSLVYARSGCRLPMPLVWRCLAAPRNW